MACPLSLKLCHVIFFLPPRQVKLKIWLAVTLSSKLIFEFCSDIWNQDDEHFHSMISLPRFCHFEFWAFYHTTGTFLKIHLDPPRSLFDQPNTIAKKVIWLDTLSEFDFEIRDIKGKDKIVADYLSRRVQVNHISIVSSYGINLLEHIMHMVNFRANFGPRAKFKGFFILEG